MTHGQHEPQRDVHGPGSAAGGAGAARHALTADEHGTREAADRRADTRHQQSWWSVVRVVDSEVVAGAERRATGHGLECRSAIRAYVHLGELIPADVRVDLHEGRLSAAEVRDRPEGARLHSVESYGNGTFVFEGCATAGIDDVTDGWTVRVNPSPSGGVGIPVPPVVGWCVPPSRRAGDAAGGGDPDASAGRAR